MFCPTCLYVSKPTIPIPDNTFILYVNTHSSLTPFPGYINKEFISPELVIDKINYSAFGFPAIVGTFPGGIIEPYNIFYRIILKKCLPKNINMIFLLKLLKK